MSHEETCVPSAPSRSGLKCRSSRLLVVLLCVLVALPAESLLLAQQAMARFARAMHKEVRGISAAAAEKLMGYEWPGNVRELQNALESAVALTRFAEITVEDLPEKIRDYKSSHVIVAADDPAELPTLDEVEKRYILRVMQTVHGNKALASRVLGLDRKTLYRKLDRYGVGDDGSD